MTMYCPNCGAKTSIDQNFCRACGLSLEKTALSLSEQLPEKVDRSVQQQKERLEKFGVALLSLFGICVLILLLFLLGRSLLSKGLPGILAMIGALILITSGLASVMLFARAKYLEENSAAADIQLSPDDLNKIQALLELYPNTGDRYTEAHYKLVDKT